MKTALRAASVGLLVALMGQPAMAGTVKIVGSSIVNGMIVDPNRAAIEKSTGHTLNVVNNATGQGMIDLSEKNADIAMMSSTLELTLASVEAMGKKLDPSIFRVYDLGSDDILFIVNSANPVNKLTMAQLGDIHTGKITNWKQVGGKDQPITVYTSTPKGSTSVMVKKVVMGGADYVSGTKIQLSLARIADLVPNDEGAIGAMGKTFVRQDGRTKVIDTPKISRPLAVVTLGEPTGKVKQVVDALKKAAK